MHTRLRIATAALAALALSSTASCSKPQSGEAGGSSASPSGTAAPSSGGVLAGTTLSMLTGFEGEIDGFTKKAGGQQTPISLFLKGDKVRFELPDELSRRAGQFLGDKAYGIFDSAAKKVYVVSDAKKQAIVMDLNSGKPLGGLMAPGSHAPGAAPTGSPSKITKTGKYDTVAGYKCENWDITSDRHEGTVCVAEQGVSWLSLPTTAIPGEHAWMAELVDGKHFPLRFVSYDKDGTTEESRVEVTKIDKKSLQDTEFQVPTGYNVIDLEKMMMGMGGMPGMPPGMPPGAFPPGAFSGRMGRPMPPH